MSKWLQVLLMLLGSAVTIALSNRARQTFGGQGPHGGPADDDTDASGTRPQQV